MITVKKYFDSIIAKIYYYYYINNSCNGRLSTEIDHWKIRISFSNKSRT